MKIKEGFILRKCGASDIVVPTGANMETHKNMMITLSGSSRILWDKLVEGCEEEDLVAALLAVYDVDEATVKGDVALFVKKLGEAGLLQ